MFETGEPGANITCGVGVRERGLDVGVADVGAGSGLRVVLYDVDDPIRSRDELLLFSLDRDDALRYRCGSLGFLGE